MLDTLTLDDVEELLNRFDACKGDERLEQVWLECNWDTMAGSYWWLSDHHSGQNSREYRLLCRINYNPAPNENEPREEEAKQAYSLLCLSNRCNHEERE